MIITIDGPSGVGKSTLARQLAERLHFSFLNSGSMYRCLAYLFQKKGLSPGEQFLDGLSFEYSVEERVGESSHYFLNGEEVTEQIYQPELSSLASELAEQLSIRSFLTDKQREWAQGKELIAEGRDMGSVVFPQAEVKIFLDAGSKERMERRKRQCRELSMEQESGDQMKKRDRRDREREHAPLCIPAGSIYIDTSEMNRKEVFDKLYQEEILSRYPLLKLRTEKISS